VSRVPTPVAPVSTPRAALDHDFVIDDLLRNKLKD
jgi:hypothetical protein